MLARIEDAAEIRDKLPKIFTAVPSLSRLALAAVLTVATLSAQAALVARSGGMVYDTVQNITWLADMNSA